MKTTIITLGLFALGLSFAEAGCSGGSCKVSKPKPKSSYTPKKKTYVKKSSSYSKKSSYKPKTHRYEPAPINIGSEYQNPRDGFMKRLATAPGSDFGYESHLNSSLVSLKRDSLVASRVSMLGKVEYGWGKTYLGYEAKNQIDRAVLNARAGHGPNCLIVVFGFADKSGPADVNLRLSKTRAENVRKHIDQLNWANGLHLKTATVAMGEKVELCRDDFGHNRVAEIWLIEFPSHPAPNHVVEVVKEVPATTTTVVTQPQIIQRAAPELVTTVAPAPVMQSSPATARMIAPAVQPSPAPVAVTRVPVQSQPTNQAVLQNLVQFLEQNIVFTSEAQRAEFARTISSLR